MTDSPLSVFDRHAALRLLSEQLDVAWDSFDRPRPADPELTRQLRERLASPLPDDPGDAAAALDDAAHVLDASVSPARPLFAAYIGSTGLEAGVIGAALGAAYDVNLASSAGAVELLDDQALRWMGQFIGYPLDDGEGVFTSGGMTSNLTALLAAREHALPGTRATGLAGRAVVAYCSDEAHHSVVRAVEVAGLGADSVRRIGLDDRRRMRVDELQRALERDRRAQITPIAVVATAGTTLTGAVDPLAEIAEVCAAHEIWLHVDGAYGAPAAAAPSTAALFDGIDGADSVSVDAHKWMGVQKACSLVMTRRRGALAAAFAHEERYMLHANDVANPVDSTLEYSRPVRSLKLWLALRTYGAAAYRGWIERTLEHTRALHGALHAHPGFEVLHQPMLSTLCFRHLPADGSDLDAHNLRLADALRADGRIYLAPAVLDDQTCLRVCFVNFRTGRDDVLAIPDVIDEVAAAIT